MTKGFFFLFLVAAFFPGFFLFMFFKEAFEEYRHTGVFSLETLIGNPALFFLSLAAFVVMIVLAFVCLFCAP